MVRETLTPRYWGPVDVAFSKVWTVQAKHGSIQASIPPQAMVAQSSRQTEDGVALLAYAKRLVHCYPANRAKAGVGFFFSADSDT